ncbi:MAG: hypothetical protein IT370_30155 [Deltaproteobacteria bacterium]|nr:hypothetical protein [Deltaproteobacteria bacterium]
MARREPSRRWPALLLALAIALVRVAAARAAPGRRADAHVLDASRSALYIDAGSADGLTVGMTWRLGPDGTLADAGPVTLTVRALRQHGAALEVQGPRPAVGATLALPALLPAPAGPGLRPPPAPPPPWSADFAALALPALRRAATRTQPAAERDTPAAATRLAGELSLRLVVATDLPPSGEPGWQELALSSQLAIGAAHWRYQHLLEARLAGAPDLVIAPLQHSSARLDVHLMSLELEPRRGMALAVGRLPALPGAGVGLVDGVRFGVAGKHGLRATAFGGLAPAPSQLGLSVSAPRAGVELAVRERRAHAGVALAADAWQGGLDRVLGIADAGLRRGDLQLGGELVVDGASDLAGRSGLRVSRAVLRARGRAAGLGIDLGASAVYDLPAATHAWSDGLPAAAWVPSARERLDVDASWHNARYNLLALAHLAGGDDDTWASGGEVGVSALDVGGLGALASVAASASAGSALDHLGARAGWDGPLWTLRIGAGYAIDRLWLPTGTTAWAHHVRVSLQRPLGRRLRLASSLETLLGDGDARMLVFVLLGWRLGG